MNSRECSQKIRERIPIDVRRKIAKSSNFSCAICGKIPIVYHHIEKWSKKHSNDENYLIAICDLCHKGIHGEGGTLFSKKELYDYKFNPKNPLILKDKLPLDRKRNYSFFIGNNFITDGKKANLIKFPGGHPLISIDTNDEILKLSVLAGIKNAEKSYLIKDNEIMIDREGIWDMIYTRNSLKIWKFFNNKRIKFIDLFFLPEVIIIKEMETNFNGIPFRIFKFRSPRKHQLNKIINKVKEYEEFYIIQSREINNLPQVYGIHNGINYDKEIRNVQKNILKINLEQDLRDNFFKNFKWKREYYERILSKILMESSIFNKNNRSHKDLYQPKVNQIIEKYSKEFSKLKDIIVKYDGIIIDGAICL